MQFRFRRMDWERRSVFRIAYRTQTHAETIQVEIEEDGLIGRGEGLGVSYHGETPDTLLAQLSSVARDVSRGQTRESLQTLLPAGGARNALDCALWDLDAKRQRRRAWELAGLDSVRPLVTDFTLGLDSPDRMAKSATAASRYSVLKLKTNGDGDLERVRAVRVARPDAMLVVDANQAWSMAQLRELAPQFRELGVSLIEQPLPRGHDDALTGFRSPVPLCADESCQTAASLPELLDRYQYVNIKLDKCGGLTEALRLAARAREMGFGLMVGCMGGSSLSMAPAFVVGQACELVDLDGPLLLQSDVSAPIQYDGERMSEPSVSLWG